MTFILRAMILLVLRTMKMRMIPNLNNYMEPHQVATIKVNIVRQVSFPCFKQYIWILKTTNPKFWIYAWISSWSFLICKSLRLYWHSFVYFYVNRNLLAVKKKVDSELRIGCWYLMNKIIIRISENWIHFLSASFCIIQLLKRDEFNGDALSNMVARFFHIFVIVLLVECKKRATVLDRASPLNSSPFKVRVF